MPANEAHTRHHSPANPENAPASTENAPASEKTHQLMASMPDALRQRLPVRGTRRPRSSALRQLILDLCRWRALSARELTMLLGRRNAKYLVRTALSPMITEGLLAYTIPEMENHPEHRYTAAEPATDEDDQA